MNKQELYFRVKKLRVKYKNNGDIQSNKILSNLIHYSFPCVYGGYVVDDGRKEYFAHYQRHYQVYKHCKHILSLGLCNVMVTFTLNDKTLNLPLKDILRKLKKCCNKNLIEWYCFADYGKENGRLHFHCIACVPFSSLKRNENGYFALPYKWNYGFHQISFIRSNQAIKYASKAIRYASKCNGIKLRNRGISKHCIYTVARYLSNKENFIPWESIDYAF